MMCIPTRQPKQTVFLLLNSSKLYKWVYLFSTKIQFLAKYNCQKLIFLNGPISWEEPFLVGGPPCDGRPGIRAPQNPFPGSCSGWYFKVTIVIIADLCYPLFCNFSYLSCYWLYSWDMVLLDPTLDCILIDQVLPYSVYIMLISILICKFCFAESTRY